MVLDKVGLHKPLPFRDGICGGQEILIVLGVIWGKDSPAAEGLSSSFWGWWSRGLLPHGGHEDHKVHHPVL